MEQDNNWLNELAEPVQQNDTSWLTELAEPANDWRYGKTESGIPTGDVQSPLEMPNQNQSRGELRQAIFDNPVTGRDMYDGMSPEQAQELYDRLGNGTGIYTDPDGYKYYLPQPILGLQNLIKEPLEAVGLKEDTPAIVTPSPLKQLGGIVSNAVRSVGQIPFAVRDMLTGRNDTEEYNKLFPKYPFSGVGKDVTEIVGLMLGGGAAFKYLGNNMPKKLEAVSGLLGKLSRSTYKVGGAAVAEAALAPENASTPISSLWNDIDYSSPAAEQVLNNRFNVMVDALFFGLGGTAVKGAAETASTVFDEIVTRKILNFTSKDARAESFVTNIIDQIASVEGADTPEKYRALMNKLIQYVDENRETVINLSKDGVRNTKIGHDLMTALEKGYQKDGGEFSDLVITRLRELRKDMMSKGAPGLENTISSVDKEYDTFQKGLFDELGGSKAINESSKGIQDIGKSTVKQSEDFVDNIKLEIYNQERMLADAFDNNPILKTKIQDDFESVGFDINIRNDMTFDKIKTQIDDALIYMRDEKNGYYKAIPDRAKVDANELSTFYRIKVTGKGKTRKEEITIPGIRQSLVDKIVDSEGNFKTLYNEILPQLGRDKLTALKTGDYEAVRKIEDLQKFINEDSLIYLIENGDEDIADAAIKARDYYVKQFAPIWREGELKNYYEAHAGLPFDSVKARRDMNISLNKMLRPSESVLSNHLIKSMENADFRGNRENVLEYFIGKAEVELLAQIRDGKGFEELSMSPAFKELTNYGRSIRENFPDGYNRVQQFVRNVQNKSHSIKLKTGELQAAEDALKEAKEAIYDDYLNEFFIKNGKSLGTPTVNSMESFGKLFDNPQNGEKIKSILAMAQNNPVVRDGMQAAFMKHLRNKLSMSSEAISGNKKLSIPQYSKLLRDDIDGGVNPLLQYGDIIFQDKPEVMEATRQFLDLNYQTASSVRAKSASGALNIAAGSTSAEFGQVVNLIITQIWGPLNRAGARIRSGASRYIASSGATMESSLILDKIYSDPEFFSETVRRILGKDQKTMSSKQKTKYIMQWLAKSQIFGSEGSGAIWTGDTESLASDIEGLVSRNQYKQEQREKGPDLFEQVNRSSSMRSESLGPEDWEPSGSVSQRPNQSMYDTPDRTLDQLNKKNTFTNPF